MIMKKVFFYGQKERVNRIYDNLKNFVGKNEVHNPGDVLCVSTKNNGFFDTFIIADGIHTFCELLDSKEQEAYIDVINPADLPYCGGKDVTVKTDAAIDAFTNELPYFKNIVASDVEVAKNIVMKATEKITLDGIMLSGGTEGVNGKLTFAAKELSLKNITAKENATLYNAFEGYQALNDENYKGIEKVTAEKLDIDCPSLTHNIINVYTPADGAKILVKDSQFNLTVDNSNILRLANYMNSENVEVVFENIDWTYENSLTQQAWGYAGLVIYQPASQDVALGGDLSKIKTWSFRFKNCRYNGEKITANNFGEHSQAFYLYNIGGNSAVAEPVAAGLNVIFE